MRLARARRRGDVMTAERLCFAAFQGVEQSALAADDAFAPGRRSLRSGRDAHLQFITELNAAARYAVRKLWKLMRWLLVSGIALLGWAFVVVTGVGMPITQASIDVTDGHGRFIDNADITFRSKSRQILGTAKHPSGTFVLSGVEHGYDFYSSFTNEGWGAQATVMRVEAAGCEAQELDVKFERSTKGSLLWWLPLNPDGPPRLHFGLTHEVRLQCNPPRGN